MYYDIDYTVISPSPNWRDIGIAALVSLQVKLLWGKNDLITDCCKYRHLEEFVDVLAI